MNLEGLKRSQLVRFTPLTSSLTTPALLSVSGSSKLPPFSRIAIALQMTVTQQRRVSSSADPLRAHSAPSRSGPLSGHSQPDDTNQMFFTKPATVLLPVGPLDHAIVPKILASPDVERIASLTEVGIDQAMHHVFKVSACGLRSVSHSLMSYERIKDPRLITSDITSSNLSAKPVKVLLKSVRSHFARQAP